MPQDAFTLRLNAKELDAALSGAMPIVGNTTTGRPFSP